MSNSKPLVSIIIPVYNSEKYIADTIRSSLNQTWENKEIIVVDDGSTDDSFSIAQKFACDFVKVERQENKGASAARNLGFSLSKGDYIQYLDADDLLAPDKIENQMNLLKDLPENYISSCSWAKFNDSIEEAKFVHQKVWDDFYPVDWLVASWTGGGIILISCWLTPRHLIEKAGPWNENLRKNPNDDGEFFCRVILNSSGIKFCESSKAYYRVHNNPRVSTNVNKIAIESLLQSYILYEKEIFKFEKSERTINAVVAKYSSFFYEFYNIFPDLALEAEKRVKNLGEKNIRLFGGNILLAISKIIGYKNALRVKKSILSLTNQGNK